MAWPVAFLRLEPQLLAAAFALLPLLHGSVATIPFLAPPPCPPPCSDAVSCAIATLIGFLRANLWHAGACH